MQLPRCKLKFKIQIFKMHEEHSGHSHHHHHHQSPAAIGKLFAIGVALNVLYIIIEAAYGLIVHSMALLSDAGHNLSDVLGLLLSWGAIYLTTKRPTKSRTYGYRKSSILAAFLNAVMLFIAIGAIAIEAIQRFTSQRCFFAYGCGRCCISRGGYFRYYYFIHQALLD